MDDSRLIDELRNGSSEAFVELYDKYWEKLYYVCYKRIGSQEETEDIIHELFLDLWKRREDLEIKTSFAAYLFTSLKYKIFRLIDSKTVRNKYMERIDGDEPASADSLERELDFNELYDFIEERIENLPERCRLIFRMSRSENLTADEIAASLDISPNTVQNQITKAKKILKNELKKLFLMFLA
jgi:RNA polymerase sigma-70 factor (family 1)